MPSHYTLRMQFGPHQDPDDVKQQLLLLAREAPVDEITFFFFGEEQNDGHETLERLQTWIDRSRPYRDAVKKAGLAVSLNPWHSMLHCERGRVFKPDQKWQPMVDPPGRVSKSVVCFLDPAWRKYYLETLRMYAREGFRVVWIDDDIRYHNHGPLEWGGCFCPLHVAEFNRRAGTNASREEIVKACLAPGAPHKWRGIWFDMWQETILRFLDECRGVLAEKGVKMGLMSSAMESHEAEGRRWADWWKAFGGGKPPVHRPHFWAYGDAGGPIIVHGIAALDQNRTIQAEGIESGPEIECFPYGRWNKSFRQLFTQMSIAHVMGSTNLNISVYDFMGNRPDDEPERASFLKKVRPTMDWLADMFPMSLRSRGVGVPWSENGGRTVRTARGASWFELECPGRGWAYWLGQAGNAFSARQQAEVNALSGTMAWSFDDAALTKMLKAGLLLDGPAAAILVERGLGKFIGVESASFVTQDQVLYSIEQLLDAEFAMRAGAQVSVNEKGHAARMLQAKLAPGVRVVSDLRNPLQKIVGHGVFTFENELGGRVAVAPWDANTGSCPLMDAHRAVQLRRLAEWLAGGRSTGSAEGAAWLVPQFLSDGSVRRGVVWNASPDAIDTFRVHKPHDMPEFKRAWHLAPNGSRSPATVEGDTVRVAGSMHQWECVVLE